MSFRKTFRCDAYVPGALIAMVLMLTTAADAHAQIGEGDAFPMLEESNLTGGEIPVTSGRVVLIDFWASWCAPCKASFPALARLHREFAERGLVIIAVSVDEKESAFSAFVKKQQPPFVTVHDAKQELVRAVNVPVMPTSYLIGRDGRVRAVHRGFHGRTSEAKLHREIAALLEETL